MCEKCQKSGHSKWRKRTKPGCGVDFLALCLKRPDGETRRDEAEEMKGARVNRQRGGPDWQGRPPQRRSVQSSGRSERMRTAALAPHSMMRTFS